MKEIVVLSGKGGTGKTTLLGSLACLAENKVLVDCDVDAADLHLLLTPEHRSENEFRSGVKARVVADKCIGCGTCQELCQFEAIEVAQCATVDTMACEGCGVCAYFCPEQAIHLDKNHCGTWYISDTKYGPLVHAQLFAGEENSGKLVSFVKRQARQVAEEIGAELLLVDGAPGIGCPVIASLSGTDIIVAVTEPTLSGWHDLERVLDLADHFQVAAFVCLNKWDLNPQMADALANHCRKRDVEILGRIPFDPAVVTAQLKGQPVVLSDSLATSAIKDIWSALQEKVNDNCLSLAVPKVTFPGVLSRNEMRAG
ncbi:MAG: ATP-binding protein [Proteobacteria bacterium]|nr:ATP-binding protein [Pseudomonadota bacterium]MBU1641165.1 ATP-binding protein [Pseudomonadota bacterium]